MWGSWGDGPRRPGVKRVETKEGAAPVSEESTMQRAPHPHGEATERRRANERSPSLSMVQRKSPADRDSPAR